jgi:hypothetical protein
MKTGRLPKFNRGGTDIQAYVYREGHEVRAALYVSAGPGRPQQPHTLTGRTESEVEGSVRAWVDAHYPRGPAR